MLRRLRELGELHREGVLTDEEFAAAKRTLLGM
ncbi:SHOCT domain-containing protein [Actinomadura adrarensis]|uniref:SHOCT domain-containing protein n=1 Tax=Actinomadura adrarensis TaxID=1819600 RepID=A0ABW3CMF2_9ACTN